MKGKLTADLMKGQSLPVHAGPGGVCAFSVIGVNGDYLSGWEWSVWTGNINRRFRTLEDAAEWLDTLPKGVHE